jgi:hypothetical protein
MSRNVKGWICASVITMLTYGCLSGIDFWPCATLYVGIMLIVFHKEPTK